jgi:hypothetical protein
VLAFALAGLGASACSGSRTEGLDPSKLPENLRGDYALFAQRCSKCHSLARPLTAGIRDDDQWVMYVNRMRRQPGSGISYEDQRHILTFLHWHAAELRRRDAEKRGEPSPPTSDADGGASSPSSSPSAPSPSAPPSAAPGSTSASPARGEGT